MRDQDQTTGTRQPGGLIARLQSNADYMADNPPATIETDSDLWRTTIALQREAADVLTAATDLLAALKVAQDVLERNGIARPEIDAAIAKAESQP